MFSEINFATAASNTAATQIVAATPGLRLMGWSVKESAGSPDVATLNLHHGTSNAGPIIGLANLAASETKTVSFLPQGLLVPGGIYLDRLSGETTVTVHIAFS